MCTVPLQRLRLRGITLQLHSTIDPVLFYLLSLHIIPLFPPVIRFSASHPLMKTRLFSILHLPFKTPLPTTCPSPSITCARTIKSNSQLPLLAIASQRLECIDAVAGFGGTSKSVPISTFGPSYGYQIDYSNNWGASPFSIPYSGLSMLGLLLGREASS